MSRRANPSTAAATARIADIIASDADAALALLENTVWNLEEKDAKQLHLLRAVLGRIGGLADELAALHSEGKSFGVRCSLLRWMVQHEDTAKALAPAAELRLATSDGAPQDGGAA